MNTRKNILVKTIYIATLLITFAAFAVGCGKATPDTDEESKKTDTTEVSTEVETETTEESEVPVDTETEEETEEPVLYKVRIIIEDGSIVTDIPSEFDSFVIGQLEYGTYYDVYGEYQDEAGMHNYYMIKMEDGEYGFIWTSDAEVVE